MADASDSKSDAGNSVWVQVPSPALVKRKSYFIRLPFFIPVNRMLAERAFYCLSKYFKFSLNCFSSNFLE